MDERLQWEYRIVELDLDKPKAPEALNNAGREGWEAVAGSLRAAVDPEAPRLERFVVLLKRLRPTLEARAGGRLSRKI